MKRNTLIATSFATIMTTTSPVIANTQDQIVCETIKICQKLTSVIQTQINELEQSNNPDFDKLDALQNKLIALENQKQTHQRKTIAEENEKQETIRTSQDQRLQALETALSLENN